MIGGEEQVRSESPKAKGTAATWRESATLTNSHNESGIKYQTIWRYAKGDYFNNPLQFGTLSFGTKTHINTNRTRPFNADYNLGYHNFHGNSSPEVKYTFVLTEAKTVTIRTDDKLHQFRYLPAARYSKWYFQWYF